jgi:hypothetical protein
MGWRRAVSAAVSGGAVGLTMQSNNTTITVAGLPLPTGLARSRTGWKLRAISEGFIRPGVSITAPQTLYDE